ncbi:MAG: transcriptional repressor [Syntrophobacteraceae bacterium]|nr:transcriptional repressor [Syntrophobacteraceae bacterium]
MEGKKEKDFIATLRAHGLQVTYQRLAIYQTMYFSREHPSAETVYQLVKKKFAMISLGTVYKTLEKFYEVGLIDKVSPITEVARYEAKTGPHNHMVCLQCQRILDADSTVEDPTISVPGLDGFHVLRRQVVLHGYCTACKPSLVNSGS